MGRGENASGGDHSPDMHLLVGGGTTLPRSLHLMTRGARELTLLMKIARHWHPPPEIGKFTETER
jgi:hypothetical protein